MVGVSKDAYSVGFIKRLIKGLIGSVKGVYTAGIAAFRS